MKMPWFPLPHSGVPCLLATLCWAVLASVPACASGAGGTADWVPVDEEVLADARGGFDGGNGLLVSLSVDRVLSLNGNVIASGQLSTADASRPAFQIARIGEGNALLQAAQPLAGLLLQNSADDQVIRSQTTIDATVNSLSILKDMNFGDSLRQSLSTAIVPR